MGRFRRAERGVADLDEGWCAGETGRKRMYGIVELSMVLAVVMMMVRGVMA